MAEKDDRIVGSPKRRVEDDRLIQGAGRYTDDFFLPGLAYAAIVRSPHAHALITHIDRSAASSAPGVLLVLTGDDYARSGLGNLPSQLHELDLPPFTRKTTPNVAPNPVLARGVVRCVGDPVAVVIAETRKQARDAAELLGVEYDPKPALIDAAQALLADAPVVWPEFDTNLFLSAELGDEKATEEAFSNAAHVVTLRLRNNRISVMSMEPRGAIGHYEEHSNRLTLYAGLQGVARPRDVLAKDIFHIPVENVRVVSHDVGGGFGMKSALYPEYVLALLASKMLKRPVKWISDRTEAFLSDSHGRDIETEAALAIDADGRFIGLKIDTLANLGAYPGLMNPVVQHVIGPATAMGVYATPFAHHRVRTVYTNTPFVGPYRGAGRPEAAYVMERLAEEAGRVTGLGPVEIRRRNFVRADTMPWRTPIGTIYDSGDFGAIMDKALALAEFQDFGSRRAEAETRGVLRGIGFSTYIESAGGRPMDWGSVEVGGDGVVTLRVGTHNHGQGHETSFAQVVADNLGVPFESVRVLSADTDDVVSGSGTHASRSMRVASTIAVETSAAILVRAQSIAEVLLDAPTSIVRDGPLFRDIDSNQSLSLFEIARAALTDERLPDDLRGPLKAEHLYQSTGLTFPNGCHVCEVEIDPETGVTQVVKYVAVDDVGQVVNPMIVEGQVHGGVAQGLGQTIMEELSFDGNGQLVTGSLMDYGVPRASDIPTILSETVEAAPTKTNPLRIKGAGEGGATAAPPAIVHAVLDALACAGVRNVDMPLTPSKIWQLLQQR